MSAIRYSRTARVQVRSFTTSPNLRVGPESPHFVDIPQVLQPTNASKPRVKGTLPVPRELFPSRRTDKPGKMYLDAVTPAPKTERKVNVKSSDPEKQAFKIKMAELRRENLREGLEGLYKRKTSAEAVMSHRSRENQKRRESVLRQSEPEDERLTRSSIVQAMQSQKHVLADPNREERLAISKARVEAQEAQKSAERQDDLHSLYMSARTFITTEEQLSAEIDRVFPDGENTAWRNDCQPGDNIWNLGTPPTVQSIVNESRKSEVARWDVLQGRVKKLGEQLTGGKL
ncbi:uncharacterized protein N7483_009293 [Penicillium malachiteum]|uniref:uncharacterized protein n=1 Tax=Penicillium malachiteum TaxID=1324776 RepID=UPI0025468998|nr:uncharacterized protein N7483_009293 [Penicillium malachiteum]KAJ5721359.1 hypothetical protein N7483_009293 [Penicillium malachiteum]